MRGGCEGVKKSFGALIKGCNTSACHISSVRIITKIEWKPRSPVYGALYVYTVIESSSAMLEDFILHSSILRFVESDGIGYHRRS